MKKLLFIMLLLFSSIVSAQEFRPSTVKSMDVTITSEATGSFSGTITRGDEMEIMFITMQQEQGQELLELNEHMEIGGNKILPARGEKNGVQYAVYKINDLHEYAKAPQFKIVREARVRRNAAIGLGEDYNLTNPIKEFPEYKKPSDYIESSDPEIMSKARLEFTSDSEIETIRGITEWVNQNITYDFDNYYSATYSAKQTYNSRAGVCDEFANLTAAFLRAKGIPARYVKGISFDGTRFGLHGWLEAYLPGTGWIGVDSTYGEAGYLDAAHFTIAKTIDANKAADLILSTKSAKAIQVQTQLGEPKIKINSVEFFTRLLDVKLEKPSEVEPLESFEIKAQLTNVSGEDAILPVELALHEDFGADQKNKIIFLKARETKEVSWKVKAPDKEAKNGYYTYGMYLLLPDGNISGTIKLVKKKGAEQKAADISVKDVSPFIDGSNLELRVLLKNNGNAEGEATITVIYLGKETKSNVNIEASAQKLFTQKIEDIQPGKVTVKVNAGVEREFEIIVPEKPAQEQPLEAKEVQPEPQQQALQGQSRGLFTGQNILLWVLGLGILVFGALIAVILGQLK